jgi:hypothetical protein
LTYKWFALTSISRPDVVPLETGMAPSSILLDRSSRKSFERFPIECGIGPVNLLEFRSLREIAVSEWKYVGSHRKGLVHKKTVKHLQRLQQLKRPYQLRDRTRETTTNQLSRMEEKKILSVN